jgi:uncharacterized Zn finger protein (UPF0148 family)
MNKFIALTLVLLVFPAGVFASEATYICPMHPQIVSDKEATCPICGMDLVEAQTEDKDLQNNLHQGHSHDSEAKSNTHQKYTCPMHPQIISDHEGSCPICGMDLVPIQSNDESAHEKSSTQMDMEEKPSITVSSSIIQNTGIRTAKVTSQEFGKDIRSFGVVEDNQRLSKDISGVYLI